MHVMEVITYMYKKYINSSLVKYYLHGLFLSFIGLSLHLVHWNLFYGCNIQCYVIPWLIFMSFRDSFIGLMITNESWHFNCYHSNKFIFITHNKTSNTEVQNRCSNRTRVIVYCFTAAKSFICLEVHLPQMLRLKR